MIIHACSASPKKDNCIDLQSSSEEFYQNPAFSEGLSEPYSVSAKDSVSKNPWGFNVRTSLVGSMTQRTFYDYCIYFVQNIPFNV